MKKLFTFLFLIVVIASGCTQSEKKEETKTSSSKEDTASKQQTQSEQGEKKIVARVNGNPIYEEDLMGRRVQAAITDEILYQEGLKQGLDKKFEREIENYKKRLIVDAVKKDLLVNLPQKEEISDEQIENYYKENQNKYTFLTIKEISVGDKNTAEEIRKKLIDGGNSTQIASEYSNSGVKLTAKDLRFVKKYNDLFEKKEAGQVSEVVEKGNQFKVLVITDVRAIPLLKAKKAIEFNIMARRRGRAIQEMVNKMKKENTIKVEVLAGKPESDENEAN
jgi:foldase protein PrsA